MGKLDDQYIPENLKRLRARALRPERAEKGPVLLLYVDGSEEMARALRYVCQRAKRTQHRIGLLYVVESVDFAHWSSVAALSEREDREEAERLLGELAEEVLNLTETEAYPLIYIRQGDPITELLGLMEEEEDIAWLTLAIRTDPHDPGPVIRALTQKHLTRIRRPVVLIPGHLSDDEIDALACSNPN